MNVKELLTGQSAEDIAAVLVDKFDLNREGKEKARGRITEFIKGLNTIEPIDTGYLLLGIFHVGEGGDFLNTCLYRKEDLVANFAPTSELAGLESTAGLEDEEIERLAHVKAVPETYGFEFSPWNEVLGYEVDMRNTQDVGVAAFCADVIYKMTFFGFDEETVAAERQNLSEAIRESEESRKLSQEEQKKYYIPAEEVFTNLGIPKQAEEEKQEVYRKICREVLTNNLRTYQALKKYVDLERKFELPLQWS